MHGATVTGPELVLVRYGELGLKKGNRASFEQALVRNIYHAIRPISPVRVERQRGRITVIPERRAQEVALRLSEIFGITSISPAWGTDPTVDSILSLSEVVVERAMEAYSTSTQISCRVSTRRADKRFPLISTELDRRVADHVFPRYGDRLRIDLKNPNLELGIDVREGRAYVFADRLQGPGGLPVGTLGRALCLLSGGIDSPVAAWMAMKRGCSVAFISFHSPPYLGEGSKRKIAQLVQTLGRYQLRNRLYSVPFTEIQTAIRDTAPEGYRTILYRRMMQRIASRVARLDRSQVLITGECLGQVASQTMENLSCIEEASELPVLRPLITFDKEETTRVARRIGTLEISNRPEPDCCTVFMPRKPVIRGRIDICQGIESELDVEGLIAAAIEAAETPDLG